MLVWKELGEVETHARVRLLPLRSVATHCGNECVYLPYRVIVLAPPHTAGGGCDVSSAYLIAFAIAFAFVDAGANLVLFGWHSSSSVSEGFGSLNERG